MSHLPLDSTRIGVGILGMGVVGSGVVKVIFEKGSQIKAVLGCPLDLRRVLVRDVSKHRSTDITHKLLTDSFADIVNDSSINVVVEAIGGEYPALDFIRKSISAGKHVVTANKEVIARHGPEILAFARSNEVRVLFEASVAGGTPIVSPLLRDLVANDVSAINGIINGTTNYILTRMAQNDVDFDDALKEAQNLGFAESDPTNDVQGVDSAFKLAILSSIAFRTTVRDTDVYREGVTRLRARDFRYARELGYAIKLMAMARRTTVNLQVRVHPVFVPSNEMMAKVDGVLNAVEVETDLSGAVLFYGQGAGAMPTTSAIMADIFETAQHIINKTPLDPLFRPNTEIPIGRIEDLETKYYLRMSVEDQFGVLAQIAKILGAMKISIDSVLQKGSDEKSKRAELVIMTHLAKEASMQKALLRLENLDVVHEVGNVVRVEGYRK